MLCQKNALMCSVYIIGKKHYFCAQYYLIGFNIRDGVLILFLSFRRVLNVNYSFLGNSPASEF